MRSKAHIGPGPAWLAILALASALPATALAAKPTSAVVPLTSTVYSEVVDQQDTIGFFGNGVGCPNAPLRDAAGLLPDGIAGTGSAWGMNYSFTETTGLTSGVYDNASYCRSDGSCLRSEFNTSDKNFTLDTRTTANPLRTFTLDFTDPFNPDPNTPSFGASLTTSGLFQILGSSSMTAMRVCSSRACPEALQFQAKFWFTDPVRTDVTWRVDWSHLRILRMSQDTWYFIADSCDGSQVAGLSELIGNRTKPREVKNGTYLVPLFIGVKKK